MDSAYACSCSNYGVSYRRVGFKNAWGDVERERGMECSVAIWSAFIAALWSVVGLCIGLGLGVAILWLVNREV